jgi:hypothetical protein
MWCNRDATYSWEKFTVIDAGSGKTALKALNKYVTTAGDGTVYCNRDAMSSLEQFQWFSNTDGTFSLKCSTGKYVTSECGNAAMHCSKDSIGSEEKFTYEIV